MGNLWCIRIIFRPTLLVAYLCCAQAQAQLVPDAGSLRPQTEPWRELPMPKAQVPGVPAAAPIWQVPGGLSITVRRFVFEGNTLLEPLVLEEAVASYIGHSLNFSQLEGGVVVPDGVGVAVLGSQRAGVDPALA